MLKSIVKMILGFAGGIAIGFLIACVVIICFTDTTFPEFLEKLTSTNLSETMTAAGVAVLAFIVSIFVLVFIHEAGHLVCGLLSGYRFVSFRIFNFTIIRMDGKLRVKRYSVAGTGGQCLLTPPDLPLDKIPTGWYNFGGVFFNLIALLIAVPFLFLVKGHPFVTETIAMFVLADILLILINGIPMKISSAGNDGYNMLFLKKDPIGKRALVEALRANALVQEGVRPKDMPAEWFVVPENICYRNQLEVSIPMMAAARLVDEMRYAEALEAYERLYEHKDEIIPLYVNEIACELVFLRLMGGDEKGAAELLDDKLRKYIETYKKVMSSKERILCAVSLRLDHDPDKALSIYENLRDRAGDYLLQGEVRSDLAIMHDMLTSSTDLRLVNRP